MLSLREVNTRAGLAGGTHYVNQRQAIRVRSHSACHSIAIHRDDYATETRPLESRFGRAVIVSLDLTAKR